MKKLTTDLCPRCKSPQVITKTWVEMMKTFDGGTSKLTFSQIECSNKECQKEFEKKREEERRKKEELKSKNESYAKNRQNGNNDKQKNKKMTLK